MFFHNRAYTEDYKSCLFNQAQDIELFDLLFKSHYFNTPCLFSFHIDKMANSTTAAGLSSISSMSPNPVDMTNSNTEVSTMSLTMMTNITDTTASPTTEGVASMITNAVTSTMKQMTTLITETVTESMRTNPPTTTRMSTTRMKRTSTLNPSGVYRRVDYLTKFQWLILTWQYLLEMSCKCVALTM